MAGSVWKKLTKVSTFVTVVTRQVLFFQLVPERCNLDDVGVIQNGALVSLPEEVQLI